MKRYTALVFLLICIFTVTGCNKVPAIDNQLENTSKNKDVIVNNLPGVAIDIKENTLSNKEATIVVNNESEHSLTFGSVYSIEKEVDENWSEIPYVIQSVGWDSIGYEVLANSSYEFEATNWEWLYGTLEAGKYRFIKDASIGSGEDLVNYYFAVEFSLEE